MELTRRGLLGRIGAVAAGGGLTGCSDPSLAPAGPTDRPLRGFDHPEHRVRASPQVTDEAVYAVTLYGDLYALDRASGEPRWAFEMGGSRGRPTVADGVVYTGDFNYRGDADEVEETDGRMFAVDAATGEERWRTTIDGNPVHAPAVRGELVLYGVRDVGVVALDRTTGEEAWRVRTGYTGAYRSGLAVDGGAAYLGNDEHLFAVDLEAREIDWQTTAPATPVDLALGHGRVYYGSGEGTRAVDRASGDPAWSTEATVWTTTGPAVGDEHVFVSQNDFFENRHRVVAFDPASGEAVWRHDHGWATFRPTRAGERLFVPTGGGLLLALDPATGDELARFDDPRGMWMQCAPTVRDGVAYVGNNGGDVYAVDAASGEAVWHTWLHAVHAPTPEGGAT